MSFGGIDTSPEADVRTGKNNAMRQWRFVVVISLCPSWSMPESLNSQQLCSFEQMNFGSKPRRPPPTRQDFLFGFLEIVTFCPKFGWLCLRRTLSSVTNTGLPGGERKAHRRPLTVRCRRHQRSFGPKFNSYGSNTIGWGGDFYNRHWGNWNGTGTRTPVFRDQYQRAPKCR